MLWFMLGCIILGVIIIGILVTMWLTDPEAFLMMLGIAAILGGGVWLTCYGAHQIWGIPLS
jgi:uncharacterized membrane protein